MDNVDVIERLILGSENLPTLPGVALKVIEAFQRHEPDIQEIGDILSTDPSLTAKILKIVNSSIYGLPTKIASVHHAIKLLGIKAIKNLALSFALINTFQSDQSEVFDYKLFWKNSIIGATAAKLIAEKLEPSLADDAFFLGLLQDIGILIQVHCIPRQYDLVLKEIGQSSNITPEAENQVLGFNHQEIGEYLTRSWELPKTLYLPIGYHHNPDKLPSAQPAVQTLTRILHLSSRFIGLLDANNRAMSLWSLKKTVNNFGLSAQMDVNEIWSDICNHTQQIFPVFDLNIDKDEYIQIIETARSELAKLSVEMISNFVEQNKEMEILKQQVTRDGMTQLFNHHHFRQLLQSELSRAQRYNRPLSLILSDIDHFKTINDTHGHLTGDRVIKALASKLKLETRDSDHVARYGGEEFAVILTETVVENAEILAERLRSKIEAMKITYGGKTISTTMSFGIAGLAEKNKKINIDELISQADDALYKAKENGRNKCHVYS